MKQKIDLRKDIQEDINKISNLFNIDINKFNSLNILLINIYRVGYLKALKTNIKELSNVLTEHIKNNNQIHLIDLESIFEKYNDCIMNTWEDITPK